jgi:hypothetical protein
MPPFRHLWVNRNLDAKLRQLLWRRLQVAVGFMKSEGELPSFLVTETSEEIVISIQKLLIFGGED